MKQKELVTLRMKPPDTGGYSLFLDYTLDGIRRKEYLKMYLVPEKSKIDKELNKQTLAAEATPTVAEKETEKEAKNAATPARVPKEATVVVGHPCGNATSVVVRSVDYSVLTCHKLEDFDC